MYAQVRPAAARVQKPEQSAQRSKQTSHEGGRTVSRVDMYGPVRKRKRPKTLASMPGVTANGANITKEWMKTEGVKYVG